MVDDTDRMLGAHGEAIGTLKQDVKELGDRMEEKMEKMSAEIAEIKQLIAGTKGGLRMLVTVASATAVLTSLLIEGWHWIFNSR